MPRDASELARRLARDAEAVCRRYLSNGWRQGRYWMVGDVRNTPGRSGHGESQPLFSTDRMGPPAGVTTT
jgi:hypothetical protein